MQWLNGFGRCGALGSLYYAKAFLHDGRSWLLARSIKGQGRSSVCPWIDRRSRSCSLAVSNQSPAGDTTMAQRLQKLAGHLDVTASAVATETVSDVDLDTL